MAPVHTNSDARRLARGGAAWIWLGIGVLSDSPSHWSSSAATGHPCCARTPARTESASRCTSVKRIHIIEAKGKPRKNYDSTRYCRKWKSSSPMPRFMQGAAEAAQSRPAIPPGGLREMRATCCKRARIPPQKSGGRGQGQTRNPRLHRPGHAGHLNGNNLESRAPRPVCQRERIDNRQKPPYPTMVQRDCVKEEINH